MPRLLVRSHTEELNADHLSYSVAVEGDTAPFNDEVTIEVLGPGVLESPRLVVNGKGDYRTVESMAAEITADCSTDEEKALAIFNWVRSHAHHQYSGDRRALNPVVFFNVFGHGICAYFACAQTALARAAGLEARVWEIKNHTVGEIFYDGAWHLLDPDCQIFYLHRDNRTIASIEQIERDLDFLKRTKAYLRLFQDARGQVRNEWQSKHLVERYDLCEPRYVQDDYDPYTYAPATMDFTLRPGEQMVRAWKGDGRHYEYRSERLFEPLPDEPHKVFPPVCYGNGHVLYRPALDASLELQAGGGAVGGRLLNVAATEHGIAVDRRQDSANGTRSLFEYRRELPYLLVGGHLEGEGTMEGGAAYDRFEVVGYKTAPNLERTVYHAHTEPGHGHFAASLDDFLYPGAGKCAWGHRVQVLMGSYSGNDPATCTALTDLSVRTDFQLNPQLLPALVPGRNEVALRHESPAGRELKVRVTHRWTERHGLRVSKAPRLTGPDGGSASAEGDVTFTWKGASGDESFHFQLSRHPQCAFPIAPNFDLDLRSAEGEFTVEAPWLAVGESYYWRVRAKSEHGIWGPWSSIRAFTYGGVGDE